MNSFGFKTPLSLRREFPFRRAGLRVERIKFSIVTPGENDPVRHRRRAGRRSTRGTLPNLPARFRINRVDVSVVSTKIEDLIVPDRRRHDAIACWEFPFHPVKLARRFFLRRSRVGRIAPEHRLRVRGQRHGRGAKPNDDTKHRDPELFHGVRRKSSGDSSAPWVSVPLISPAALLNRPSNVIPNSSDLTVTKFSSCVTKLTGTLFTFLPTIVNSSAAPSPPRLENFIVACRG